MTRQVQKTDIIVGENVKKIRRQKRKSQEDLARWLGITFQQVQKYEQGRNRISCSRLYAISQFLEAPVSEFFAGLPSVSGKSPPIKNLDKDEAQLLNIFKSLNKSAKKSLIKVATLLRT